jgi:hypothetical protein
MKNVSMLFKCVLFSFFFLISREGLGLSTHTSTKDCTLSPCTTTGTGSFSITTAQKVHWSANYLGWDNDPRSFYLSKIDAGHADLSLAISTSLARGYNEGEYYLEPGNYFISINTMYMGAGNYSIEYDRIANINLSETFHDFLNHDQGSSAIENQVTITLTEDFLDVSIDQITSNESHFTVTGFTPVVLKKNGPLSTDFRIKFTPGNNAGYFSGIITVVTSNPDVSVPDKQVNVEGDVILLAPDINCSATSCGVSTVYSTADGFANQETNFNVSFSNIGNKVLDVTDIYLSDNEGSVFSLNGVPNKSDLTAGSTRNVSIHFAPPAGTDQTYCGSITIISDSPGEEIHKCYFLARQHHPEPKMYVESNLLDYREVEYGFTFTKAIHIKNTGDANLNLNLNFSNPADPDLDQWSENQTTNNFLMPPGGEQYYLQRFTPKITGIFDIQMKAQGTGGNGSYSEEIPITLRGSGTNPIPMDNILVIDRSGSMVEPAGSRIKIEALQKAAMLYHDLLRADNGDGNGDKLGFVKYNQSNEVYELLDFKNATTIPITQDNLSDQAISDLSRLKPDGTTSIGGALLTGADQLISSPDVRKQIMVLLSDGKENTPPYIESVLSGIILANPDLKIYSVGLGNDINREALQSVTTVGKGFYQVTSDLSGTSHFALEEFYFKIYANASGADLIIDPTEAVDISTLQTVIVNKAKVVSSDRYAVFMVLDDPVLSGLYNLEFVAPDGNVITPSSSIGSIPVQVMKQSGYSLYKIIFPDVSQSATYTGDWILRLIPNGKWNSEYGKKAGSRYEVNGEWIQPYRGLVPIGFGAAVKSDYNMDVEINFPSNEPGTNFFLSAKLTDRGWPSIGGSVYVEIARPDSRVDITQLFDDGTHNDSWAGDGIYTNNYSYTGLEGTYKLFFNGIGKNYRGELVPRQATRYIELAAFVSSKGCPCVCCPAWLKYFIVIALVIIIILIFNFCRKMKTGSIKTNAS